MSALGTLARAASNSSARRSRSGGGIVSVLGRNADLATASGRRDTAETPRTQARRGRSATASRNQRMMAATWLRNRASSPTTASSLSRKITAGRAGLLTAFSSSSSNFCGLNTSSRDTSRTGVPTASAAAATISDLPQPAGPSSNTPATLGRSPGFGEVNLRGEQRQPAGHHLDLGLRGRRAALVPWSAPHPTAPRRVGRLRPPCLRRFRERQLRCRRLRAVPGSPR